jgi:peptidyl-dipeptidase Dcp
MSLQNENPLLLDSPATPFDKIRETDFVPAFEAAFTEARANLERIRSNPAPADFENTVVALEACSDRLDRVAGVFGHLLHAETSERLEEIAREMMPRLESFSNDIHHDAVLFARVKAVHSNPPATLTGEQKMLLSDQFREFRRNGALLTDAAKARVREIDERRATVGQNYSERLLKATNAYELHLTNPDDLAGLPEAAREAAEAEAKSRNKTGWVFTLDQPSLLPFLKFSERRELREKLWRAHMARATQGETDNRPNVVELSRLRHERARILGYETHAHFVLEERMAGDPAKVRSFLDRLLAKARPAALKELEEVRALSGLGADLRPWDFAFWSERLQQRKFDFDEESVRPFFPMEKVIEGVFEHARRLYGLEFRARADLPLYHADVRAYEVFDGGAGGKSGDGGESLGLLYADLHPRPSKRAGAWMDAMRDQGLWLGKIRRPHVMIVGNLTKPTPGKPSLLGIDEVRTIFHEFGHALHALLSRTTYRSLSGANVYWDFVELPSQIMENWVREKEGLDLFARHFETGQAIPAAMIEKIQATSRFQAGWFALRQVAFADLDLAWHCGDLPANTDVEAHETRARERTSLLPPVAGALISPSFSHIFAGGYSAGYYSYKWAEVLDADAFELFKEKGIFNREVASRFRDCVLSRGGTEHPMELYKRFRGREPDPDALLRRDGLA